MTKDKFLELSEADQLSWLTAQTDAERTVDEICEELGCTRANLQGYGYTYALGKWRYLSFKDRSSVLGVN